LSQVLSKRNIFYGIEVPTKEKYGETKFMSARTDLSIFENSKPTISIELKEGQNSKIENDFEKLLLEDVKGACFFHVIERTFSNNVLLALSKHYEKAYLEAKQKVKPKQKWFMLFVFAPTEKKFFCIIEDDIGKMKKFTAELFSY
jgi:hypothetical protein